MNENRINILIEHYKNNFGIDADILREIIENVVGEVLHKLNDHD